MPLNYPVAGLYLWNSITPLFPPEIRERPSTDTEKLSINPESQEVRSWIRSQMKAGEIPLEAEVQLESESRGRSEKLRKVWDGIPIHQKRHLYQNQAIQQRSNEMRSLGKKIVPECASASYT